MTNDPLTEKLTRFTPDGSGLDRDALLFAAGRASVRGKRFWPVAALLLAVGNGIILLAWSQAEPLVIFSPPLIRFVVPEPAPAEEPSPLLPSMPSSGYGKMQRRWLDSDEPPPLPVETEIFVVSPPLRAADLTSAIID